MMKYIECSWKRKIVRVNQSIMHSYYPNVLLFLEWNVRSTEIASSLGLSFDLNCNRVLVNACSNPPLVYRKLP